MQDILTVEEVFERIKNTGSAPRQPQVLHFPIRIPLAFEPGDASAFGSWLMRFAADVPKSPKMSAF
jgi:hypothetical protein